MATARGRTTPPVAQRPAPGATPSDGPPRTVEQQLFAEPFEFDFFAAVRLLERLKADAEPVGRDGPPSREPVRFRAHSSFAFPPSSIHNVVAEADPAIPPRMTVTFFGLTGPTGALPRHYTELVLRTERDSKHGEKQALRDWLDLFNHRLLSLFYRAWEKYRFYIPYERGEWARDEPDPFTECLLSLVGIALPALRNRLLVAERADDLVDAQPEALARVPDMAVVRYAALFAKRPPTAAGLTAILADYFEVPLEVRQFQGQWLGLSEPDQSRMGIPAGHCSLGVDAIVGQRVWDVAGKIRVRLGPLNLAQFTEFLPDPGIVSERKGLFLLCQLTRLYIGSTLEFDVQLVLRAEDGPGCRLGAGDPPGPRLGWNTWLASLPRKEPAEDAIFASAEVFWLNDAGWGGRAGAA